VAAHISKIRPIVHLRGLHVSHYDFVVIGAGVIGASVAHHLAAVGAQRVLVVDQGTIGAGTTN